MFSYWERISTSIFWIDLDSVIWMGLRGPNCFFWIETQWTNYGKRPGDPEAEVEIVVPGEGVEWKKKVKRFRRSKAAKGHQKLQTSVISTYRITSNHVGLSFCNLAFGNRTVFNLNQLNRLQSNRLHRVRQNREINALALHSRSWTGLLLPQLLERKTPRLWPSIPHPLPPLSIATGPVTQEIPTLHSEVPRWHY